MNYFIIFLFINRQWMGLKKDKKEYRILSWDFVLIIILSKE